MDFAITPNEGVGPVKFGMTSEEVAAIEGVPDWAISGTRDHGDQLLEERDGVGLDLVCDSLGRVARIEMRPHIESVFQYENQNIFDMSDDDPAAWLRQFGETISAGGDQISTPLGLVVPVSDSQNLGEKWPVPGWITLLPLDRLDVCGYPKPIQGPWSTEGNVNDTEGGAAGAIADLTGVGVRTDAEGFVRSLSVSPYNPAPSAPDAEVRQPTEHNVVTEVLKSLEHFSKLETLNLTFNPLSPEQGKILAKVQRLKSLAFTPSADGIDWLGSLTQLEELILRPAIPLGSAARGTLTGSDLKNLGALASLRSLHFVLEDTQTCSLADIEPLEHLEDLQLQIKGDTVADLGALRGVQNLVHLYLLGEVSKENAQQLGQLPVLRFLRVKSKTFTDTDAAALSQIKSLRWLYIQAPELTDRAIESFGKLKSLQCLILHRTSVTREAVDRLREGLPNLWVERF